MLTRRKSIISAIFTLYQKVNDNSTYDLFLFSVKITLDNFFIMLHNKSIEKSV